MEDFPKTIYVTRDENDTPDEETLLCWKDPDSTLENGEKVAIYELKEIKTRKVITELV